MSTSENITFARSLRSKWRDDEEEHTLESFEYAKRNTSLIDYLAIAASEDYKILISTPLNNYEGNISFIGANYFSIIQSKISKQTITTSFPIFNTENITISICSKNKDITKSSQNVYLVQKSFKALLDEISSDQINISIETKAKKEVCGQIESFKDFFRINIRQNNKDQYVKKASFINEGSTLINQDSIISISSTEQI